MISPFSPRNDRWIWLFLLALFATSLGLAVYDFALYA
jgi:hypothetical protein